jgi:hypothetical protein
MLKAKREQFHVCRVREWCWLVSCRWLGEKLQNLREEHGRGSPLMPGELVEVLSNSASQPLLELWVAQCLFMFKAVISISGKEGLVLGVHAVS